MDTTAPTNAPAADDPWADWPFADTDAPTGECCPDCNGEGAVLSDRPGYVQVCPTCRGEGEVYEEADSVPDTEHDAECPCERCREERIEIGTLYDMGLIP